MTGWVKSGTGILPVRLCGIGILPMLHGLGAHATKNRLLTYSLREQNTGPLLAVPRYLRSVRRCSQRGFLVTCCYMEPDPIIQQVRAVRKEIEQQYPDAASFYRHLEQVQKTYRKRLVRGRPKKSPRVQAS